MIEKGEGDLDSNGNYSQGHVFNPNGVLTVSADMSNPSTTIQYYKVVDPTTRVVSNVTVNDILSNPDIVGLDYDTISGLGNGSVDSNDPWYNKAIKTQQLQKAYFSEVIMVEQEVKVKCFHMLQVIIMDYIWHIIK